MGYCGRIKQYTIKQSQNNSKGTVISVLRSLFDIFPPALNMSTSLFSLQERGGGASQAGGGREGATEAGGGAAATRGGGEAVEGGGGAKTGGGGEATHRAAEVRVCACTVAMSQVF